MKLWYDQPGKKMFDKTLPLGSGILGAMVFPDAKEERIALNHTWLWRRFKTAGMKNPECSHWLPHIRKLFFDGKMEEAGNLANWTLGSQARSRLPFYLTTADAHIGFIPKVGVYGPDPYVPAGDLMIRLEGENRGEHFYSSLDLDSGEAYVETGNGEKMVRQVAFVSRVRDVLLLRISSETALEGTIHFSRVEDPDCELQNKNHESSNTLCMTGTFVEGRTFAMQARFSSDDGILRVENDALHFNGVHNLTAAVAVATDHEGPDPTKICEQLLQCVTDDNFDLLRKEAFAAHYSLMSRVSFKIDGEDRSHIPTNQRVAEFGEGVKDNGFQELMLQLHRYLVISYSKKGGVPGNLKGIWSDEIMPSHCCDLHHDINAQGNYFSVDALAIPETADVLFDFLESLIPSAKEAAQKIYGCRGIFIPLTSSCWPECFKLEPGWDEMVSAAAWYCQHYWWRWEFERDEEFLKNRCYPFLRETALFYMDYLVPDPRTNHRNYGKLQAVPSYSPENAFIGGNKPVSLSISCSYELELIQEVFENALEAAKILGEPEEVQAEYQYVLDHLAPLPIDEEGVLQEWSEDYPQHKVNGEPQHEPGYGHRHLSPMIGVFPGQIIGRKKTPELAEAAYKAMQRRIQYGGSRGGWSAWGAAILARLGHSEEAQERLRVYAYDERIKGRPILSPDGGLFSCVASAQVEMVLQSHEGAIRLLPALPEDWKNGEVSGLRARGGFEVDMRWENGQLVEATIISHCGMPCSVSVGDHCKTLNTQKGGRYVLNGQLQLVS